MQKVVKQNGVVKKENAIVKKEVQKKLTEQAIGKSVAPINPYLLSALSLYQKPPN